MMRTFRQRCSLLVLARTRVMTRSNSQSHHPLERLYPVVMSDDALRDIAQERERLRTAERPWNGRLARAGELPKAAAALALASVPGMIHSMWPQRLWPWPAKDWELLESRDYLVRAGALIVMAIERLDRES